MFRIPALFVLLAGLLLAQDPAGEIRLEIRDPSGAGMEASGRLAGPDGIDRTFQTDAEGRYVASGLPQGRYRIEISKTGFLRQSVTIDLFSAAPATRTITLPVGGEVARVDVVATTPLPGTDLPLAQIPAPVQMATARDLDQSGALELSDFMKQRLDGVHINQNQENPYQPDLNYRGYTASPLLGTPEGISVFVDGVRQNQPFGDIVAWDLIPKVAISEVALMPGSNPLFGLNTLGGAVSVETKDGRSQPGVTLQVSGGSFGRRAGEFEYGGSNPKGLSWYVAGNLFREDGWRAFSPSEVRQSFGKLGWQHGRTLVSLSFAYADNWLTGNGLQDTRVLAKNYSSVYTVPDITWNRSPSLNLSLRREVRTNFMISGNAYFRYIRADTTNGNLNPNSFAAPPRKISPSNCIAQGLEADEPIEACTGLFTNTYAKQHNYGLSGQAEWLPRRQHIIVGAAWDRSSLTFQQASRFGYLNADGVSITPINAFLDGSTNQDGIPLDTRVGLRGRINTPSLFAADSIAAGKWAFTVSGRYNRTSITNTDLLPPAAVAGVRGSLNGDYVFERFNPSAGLTYSPSQRFSVYFNYSEASRAPTAIELGCADPNFPCNLPNALVSDPPLKQVVTRTWEAGARGSFEGNLRWSAGWFRGENYNDLLFVASQQTGFGYFTNFGQTRREGVEASVSGHYRRLTLGGNYTYLSATYQSSQTINGASNSSNDSGLGLDGDITVQPGDRIPLTPRNILKAFAEYQPHPKIVVSVDFDAVGRSYARGNENNLYQPDGVYYLGPGFSPGYGVLNAGAQYQAQKHMRFFVQIDNLLNHRYYTAAQLGPTPYDNAGNFIARPFTAVDGNYPIRTTTFFAPGAPIGAWGGIRFKF